MGIPWTTLPSPHRFHCVLNVINCRDVCTGQRSFSLFLLPQSQKALTLCGEPHTFPGTLSWPGSDFWLRSADGEGETYVKDAQQHCLQHQGLELQVPGNLCQFCESNWNSVISQIFLWEWRHCSQSTWVSEYQLSCNRKGCFPCFPCEQPH